MKTTHDYNLIITMNEIDHIVENLYLGACPKDIRKFKYVFALNGLPSYHIEIGQMVVIRPFNDCALIPSEDMLHDLAKQIVKANELGPTLVHCQMGLNRSSLVLALALMYKGMSAVDSINLLRDKRGADVLHNKTFTTWLLNVNLDKDNT